MAHLSAFSRFPFSIQMNGCSWFRCQCAPFVDLRPNKIAHDRVAMAVRRAEWPAGYCTYMVFELAYDASLQCPVAAIVDARGHLVD